MSKLSHWLTSIAAMALTACGSGGQDATNLNVVGVYDLSSFSEQPFGLTGDLTGALSSEGEILLYNFAAGRAYTASVGNNGDRVEGPFRGYDRETGSSFNLIGNKAATGSVAGAADAFGASGSYQVDGIAQAGTFSLKRQEATLFPASVAFLVGIWSNQDAGSGYTQTLTVGPLGSYTGSDSLGCTYTGTLALLDPTINVYRNTGTVECPGKASINGSGVAFRVLPIVGGAVQTGMVLGISDANRTSVARLIKQTSS